MPEDSAGRWRRRSPHRRATAGRKTRETLCGGSGCSLPLRCRRLRFFPADANELGDARLLHGHTVEHAAYLHGLAVVGDDDELCLAAHFTDQAREATDIGFVEWCVDLVQDTERAGLVAENGDEQSQRGHGL